MIIKPNYYSIIRLNYLKYTINNSNKLHLVRLYSSKFDPKDSQLIFVAPSGRPIELIKRFSFVTSCLGSVSVPLFYFCWDMPWVQEADLAYWNIVAAFAASVGSTSFLHWFCSPYVKRAYLDMSPANSQLNKGKAVEDFIMTPTTSITMETTNLIGGSTFSKVELQQLEPGNQPHCTWKIHKTHLKKGQPKKFWIDLPNRKYPGYDNLTKIDKFIREWNRQ